MQKLNFLFLYIYIYSIWKVINVQLGQLRNTRDKQGTELMKKYKASGNYPLIKNTLAGALLGQPIIP